MISKLTPLLSGFARKRELWWQFTVRAVEVRHRGSFLGAVWLVLNPLLMLSLYVVVFGEIFGSKIYGDSYDFALAVFLGLSLFHVVSETIAASPHLIIGNPNLVKKVVFPLEILPLSSVSAYWFHFLINMVLLFVGALLIGKPVYFGGLLWMPLILGPLILFTLGVSWFISALGVFFRDITHITQVTSQIVLYGSAIFYSTEKAIEKGWWPLLKWNPLLHTVELSRQALLWNQPMNLRHLAFTWAAGAAFCVAGRVFFQKTKHAFADVI